MLRFVCFGSGSSGNCYCLTTENGSLLIDAGIGIRALKRGLFTYGISAASIHAVVVTHDHADHIKAVGAISNERQLPVYTTAEVHQGIARNYCVSKKIPVKLQHNVSPGQTFQVADFAITPFSVPHDSTDCVGYRIVADGKTFVLITDAGRVTPEMAQRVAEANYLVIEANHDIEMLEQGPYPQHLKHRIASDTGHLSNEACAQTLVENLTPEIRHIWLCHLSEENNHPELARKTVESALRSHGIIVGADLELDVLRRKTPTGPFEL